MAGTNTVIIMGPHANYVDAVVHIRYGFTPQMLSP